MGCSGSRFGARFPSQLTGPGGSCVLQARGDTTAPEKGAAGGFDAQLTAELFILPCERSEAESNPASCPGRASWSHGQGRDGCQPLCSQQRPFPSSLRLLCISGSPRQRLLPTLRHPHPERSPLRGIPIPGHPHPGTPRPRAAVGGPAPRGGKLRQAKADEVETSKQGKEERPPQMRTETFLFDSSDLACLLFSTD